MPHTYLNPYLNRRPVTDPREFHGRKIEVTDLLQRLINSTNGPQCCLLLGMGRVGKSSVFHFLRNPQGARERHAEYWPSDGRSLIVLVDIMGFVLNMGDPKEGLEVRALRAMTRSLVRELEIQLGDPAMRSTLANTIREIRVKGSRERFQKTSLEELHHVLEHLHEALLDAGYRTIYLIDGVDSANIPLPEHFATRLRYYFNTFNVGYVIASLRPLKEILETGSSSELYNVFNTVLIGPLIEEAAVDLLRNPLGVQDEGWSDHFIHTLLEEVGTHPDLVKMAAARAWALRNVTGKEPQIGTVLEAICPDMEGWFDSIFKRFDDSQKSEMSRAEPNLTAALLSSHAAVAQGARLGRRFHEWVRHRGPAAEMPTLEGNRLSLEGRIVELTPIEQQLVARLLAHHGRAVSRQALQAEIWSERDAKSKALDTTIQRLRDKLGDDRADPRWILTVRGHGYAFGPMQGNVQ